MINAVPARLSLVLLLVIGSFMMVGCASTEVRKSWTAPGVSTLKFSKILIVAMTHDDIDRRLAENTVKGHLPKQASVVSHQHVPGVLGAGDKAKILQAIKDTDVDGVVVMRVTGSDTKVSQGGNAALPMEYMTFSSYYGSVYDVSAFFASDTRSIYADRIFYIETNVYDAKTEKLLWSTTTKSTKTNIKAQNIGALVAEIAETLRSTLEDQKLIR